MRTRPISKFRPTSVKPGLQRSKSIGKNYGWTIVGAYDTPVEIRYTHVKSLEDSRVKIPANRI